MDRKSKRLFFVFGGGLLFYIVLFPVSLGKELVVQPVWSASLGDEAGNGNSIKNANAHVPDGTDILGFQFEKRLGYISREGQLVYDESIMYGASISDEYFTNYSSVPDSIFLKNSEGRIVASLSERGYPLIRNGRLFVFDSDREGVSEWDFSGKEKWKKRFPSVVTDVSVNRNSVLVGLLDGDAVLLDEEGRDSAVLTPGGSRLPVVYGVAVSPDNNGAAVISGIDPLRFVLYQRKKDSFKPVYHENLNADFRRRIFIAFSADGRYILHEDEASLAVFDIQSQNVYALPFSGKLERIVSAGAEKAAILTSDTGADGQKNFVLTEFLYPDRVYMRLKLSSSSVFTRLDGSALFFGSEGSIFRVDTVEG